MAKEQTSKGFQYLVGAILFAFTCLVIFNTEIGLLKWITNYSVQIMLGMLLLGFLFFILGQERMMFSSLICCSLLCLFLQKSANTNLVLPKYSAGTAFKVAHANLTNVDGDINIALNSIVATDADLISLQEVNFPLNDRILAVMGEKYPYSTGPMKQNDFWSINVFSKHPFSTLDTIYMDDIPTLVGGIQLQNESLPINFISTYLLPPFSNDQSFDAFKSNLDTLTKKRPNRDQPLILFGDFNVTGWNGEMEGFKSKTDLEDSRRAYMPAVNDLFSYPIDHIFFSKQLKCVSFEIIKTPIVEDHVGITGVYQLEETALTEVVE